MVRIEYIYIYIYILRFEYLHSLELHHMQYLFFSTYTNYHASTKISDTAGTSTDITGATETGESFKLSLR